MHSFNIFGACSLAASSCLRSAHDFQHSHGSGENNTNKPIRIPCCRTEQMLTVQGDIVWKMLTPRFWMVNEENRWSKIISDGKCLGTRPSCYFRYGHQTCPSAWLELMGPPHLLSWEETIKTGPLTPKWWLLYWNETSVSTIWHHLPHICFQKGDVTLKLMNICLTAI